MCWLQVDCSGRTFYNSWLVTTLEPTKKNEQLTWTPSSASTSRIKWLILVYNLRVCKTLQNTAFACFIWWSNVTIHNSFGFVDCKKMAMIQEKHKSNTKYPQKKYKVLKLVEIGISELQEASKLQFPWNTLSTRIKIK